MLHLVLCICKTSKHIATVVFQKRSARKPLFRFPGIWPSRNLNACKRRAPAKVETTRLEHITRFDGVEHAWTTCAFAFYLEGVGQEEGTEEKDKRKFKTRACLHSKHLSNENDVNARRKPSRNFTQTSNGIYISSEAIATVYYQYYIKTAVYIKTSQVTSQQKTESEVPQNDRMFLCSNPFIFDPLIWRIFKEISNDHQYKKPLT